MRSWTSRWLPGKRLVVADTTYDGYRRNVESHIVPALGRISLRRLRPHHLETFYDGLLHPRDDRHPLAPKTVYEMHLVVRNGTPRSDTDRQLLCAKAQLSGTIRHWNPGLDGTR